MKTKILNIISGTVRMAGTRYDAKYRVTRKHKLTVAGAQRVIRAEQLRPDFVATRVETFVDER